MGSVRMIKCPNCNKEYTLFGGYGMWHMRPYAEQVWDTRRRKSGAAEAVKDFFDKYEGGYMSLGNKVVRCTSCGRYGTESSLRAYTLKEGHHVEKDYLRINSHDLEEHFDFYKEYDHICPECGALEEGVPDFEKDLAAGKLKCGKCSGTMTDAGFGLWD